MKKLLLIILMLTGGIAFSQIPPPPSAIIIKGELFVTYTLNEEYMIYKSATSNMFCYIPTEEDCNRESMTHIITGRELFVYAFSYGENPISVPRRYIEELLNHKIYKK